MAALLAAAALDRAPSAGAQAPCWQQVVADWSQGAVGGEYPIACYQTALRHLPEDVRVYSSAEDDIRRAMLAAITARATPPPAPPAATAPTRRVESAPRKARPRVLEHASKPAPRPDPAASAAAPLAAEQASPGGDSLVPALLLVLVACAFGLALVAAVAAAPLRQAQRERRRRGGPER